MIVWTNARLQNNPPPTVEERRQALERFVRKNQLGSRCDSYLIDEGLIETFQTPHQKRANENGITTHGCNATRYWRLTAKGYAQLNALRVGVALMVIPSPCTALVPQGYFKPAYFAPRPVAIQYTTALPMAA